MNFKAVWNEFTSLTAQEITNLEQMKKAQIMRRSQKKANRGLYCVETGQRFKDYEELGNHLNVTTEGARNVIKFDFKIKGKHYKECGDEST